MRRLSALAAVALAVLAVEAIPARKAHTMPAAAPLEISQHLRIMPLGDSITRGEGSSTGDGYRWHLASSMLDVQHWYTANWVGSQEDGQQPNRHHEGHSGWRIDQLTAQAAGWVTAQEPDVVLVQGGTNDALQGADADTMISRMDALIGAILAASPTVLVIVADLVPTWWGTDRDIASVAMQRYNVLLPSLVDLLGERVTLARWSAAVPSSLLTGGGLGLHLGDDGYRRAAWVWLRCLGTLISPDGVVRAGGDPLPMPIPTSQLCHTG